jgi:hypothetical protein
MSEVQQPPSQRKSLKWIDAWRVTVAAILGTGAIAVTLMGCVTDPTSASDAISLDYKAHGWIVGFGSEGGIDRGDVVRDFDPSRGLDYYIDNKKIAYSSPVPQIDVWSKSAN